MKNLKEILIFHNPWWVSGEVPEELCPAYERGIIRSLISYLDLERIIILKGPRGTGKTTLMYQLIRRLLHSGVTPKRILFLSFDDIEAREPLDDIIQAYEQICKMPVSGSAEEAFYFIFDEVHFWRNWQFYIKKYFDRKYPIKFIATSSAASVARHDTESLTGRTVEEVILPFNFFEYISYKHRGQSLVTAISRFRKRENLAGDALPDITDILPYKKEILIAFNEYIEKGGFPHIFPVHEPIIWKRLLRDDVIDKVIYRDLVQMYEIRKPFVLEKLLLYLADTTAELLNVSNISNSLKISREYAENYLRYLKQAYLVMTVRRYSPSMEKRLRASEKLYLVDSGLLTALGITDDAKVVEAIACRHLMDNGIYYWRNGTEVDFVIKRGKSIIPVEVKYGKDVQRKELKGLIRFATKHKISEAIIITKELMRKDVVSGINVYFIPAWVAFSLC